MKAIPAVPAFTKVDVAALKAVNWTAQATAGPAVLALQQTVQQNVAKLAAYQTDALAAGLDRVRVMQDGVGAVKKRQPSPPEIDSDPKLKAVRDDVKTLMTDSAGVVKGYTAAMGEFRNALLDFAGTFKPLVSKIRSDAQDKDKEVANVPAKLVSMETAASALIKELRELRGQLTDNIARKDKIESAADKAMKTKLEAGTAMDKVESAVRGITDRLASLPGSLAEMQTRAKDCSNAKERFATAMTAINLSKDSIGTMIKGFTGHGFEDMAKPKLKEVETAFSELMKRRDAAQKSLEALRKKKELPEAVRKALPEKL